MLVDFIWTSSRRTRKLGMDGCMIAKDFLSPYIFRIRAWKSVSIVEVRSEIWSYVTRIAVGCDEEEWLSFDWSIERRPINRDWRSTEFGEWEPLQHDLANEMDWDLQCTLHTGTRYI